jgi:soluble cytochrome b562
VPVNLFHQLRVALPKDVGLPRLHGVMTRLTIVLCILLACLAGSPARADVGVVLNESLDTSVARITGSGHSAVYFSRICPETPVKLRLCGPGEQGSVMSNYTTLGEDQPFEWNIVPLSIYLYGVEDPQDRPLFASWKIKHALEERYRKRYLSGLCDGKFCRTSYNAEWREMVGASLERSMYIFILQTTVEQDRALIAEFNSQPNVNHFNGVIRNCADFTRRVINFYFPHAAKADHLNDFGMTTPKAIARSFSHYGARHPEAHFRVLHFAQASGTIKRSTECRAGTEQLFRSKKLLVPMLVFADHELPFVAASYVFTGRFNPEHELENYPTVEAADLSQEIRAAKSEKNAARAAELESLETQEREEVVGTAQQWKEYREAFDSLVEDAVHEELISNRDDLSHFFKYLDHEGTPRLDASGAAWLDIYENGATLRIGLSPSNFLASGSDPQLSYELALARTSYFLKSPKHRRESMPEFKADWELIHSARLLNTPVPPANQTVADVRTVSPSLRGNQ